MMQQQAKAVQAQAQAAQQAQVQAGQPQALQRVQSGGAGPSGVQGTVVSPAAQPAAAAGQPAAQKQGGGLPMAELIQVIREHPELKSQIQEIVQRKDLQEQAKMATIQRIVREAQPPAAAAPPPAPPPQ